jgi:uncharacterized protein YndB with AHSA1/START domain
MNPSFEFTVDKAAKTIHITREFDADIDLVWDAFTKAEILDLWTAPKPFTARTKEMDFREGGRWLYAMITAEGNTAAYAEKINYSMVEYIKIDPKNGFYARNSFADENGNSLNDKFSMTRTTFKPEGEKTTVHIEKVFEDLALLEWMAAGFFKEGMSLSFVNLDEYFSAHVVKK